MPFSEHFLLQYGGTMGTAGEIWSNGIRFATQADLDTDPEPGAWLTAAQAAISALISSAASAIPVSTKLTYLKFNKIGPDGRYVSNTESNTRFLSGTGQTAGGSSATFHPYSVTVAVSWLTDFQRGRGSKGRIFSPGYAKSVTQEGQLDANAVGQMAGQYAATLDALNDIGSVPGDRLVAVVASGINGALNPIRRVSIGSVPDTMRSRRNQLVETRTSVALS